MTAESKTHLESRIEEMRRDLQSMLGENRLQRHLLRMDLHNRFDAFERRHAELHAALAKAGRETLDSLRASIAELRESFEEIPERSHAADTLDGNARGQRARRAALVTATTLAHGKTTYRVAPIDGAWVIELVGDSVREHASYKAEAIARARELAKRAPHGAVAVFGADGLLENEFDVQHDTVS